MTTCSNCRQENKTMTGVEGAATPRPGDVSVCSGCGHIGFFTADGIRSATPEEMACLVEDPRIQPLLDSIKGHVPQVYRMTLLAMEAILRGWLKKHPGEPPLFALPPKELFVVGSLEGPLLSRVGRNTAALTLLGYFQEAGRIAGRGDRWMPTLAMLEMVLDRCGVEPERVSFGDLGLAPLGSHGPAQPS